MFLICSFVCIVKMYEAILDLFYNFYGKLGKKYWNLLTSG